MSEPIPEGERTVVVADRRIPLAEAQNRIRNSANWFWWIAGLSVINSLATMFDLKYGMVLGLGVGQLIDGLAFYTLDGERIDPTAMARVIHAVLTVAVVGVFVALGWFARRDSLVAFVVGIGLYALDSLIFLVLGDWIAVGFHVFVLVMLAAGMSLLRTVRRQVPAEATAAA